MVSDVFPERSNLFAANRESAIVSGDIVELKISRRLARGKLWGQCSHYGRAEYGIIRLSSGMGKNMGHSFFEKIIVIAVIIYAAWMAYPFGKVTINIGRHFSWS
jgi:hypothetical protein